MFKTIRKYPDVQGMVAAVKESTHLFQAVRECVDDPVVSYMQELKETRSAILLCL